MKSLLAGLLVVLGALMQGCTYPAPAKITQKDIRPAIGVSNAPAGSALYVDGLRMGMASEYNGTNSVLLVESGKHLIEVKTAAGETVLSETLFLGSSTTKILTINP